MVDDDRGHVRLYVSRGQATAFCDHADRLVNRAALTANGAHSRSILTATPAPV